MMVERKRTKKEEVFLSTTRKRVGKAVHKYKIIKDGDNVMVAVSGGKDSLFLLEALAMQRKHFPINFTLQAIHIDVTDKPYKIDRSFLDDMCRLYDIPLHIKQIETGDITATKKSPCFACSWQRRDALFRAMEEFSCNKLALGHHMDDAIETLLLNMTHHGNISAMPPTLEMFKGKFEIIRPLILVEEKNITKYTTLSGFPDEIELCPYEEKGNRFAMKKIIADLEKQSKNARINLLRSMSKIDHDYLV